MSSFHGYASQMYGRPGYYCIRIVEMRDGIHPVAGNPHHAHVKRKLFASPIVYLGDTKKSRGRRLLWAAQHVAKRLDGMPLAIQAVDLEGGDTAVAALVENMMAEETT